MKLFTTHRENKTDITSSGKEKVNSTEGTLPGPEGGKFLPFERKRKGRRASICNTNPIGERMRPREWGEKEE